MIPTMIAMLPVVAIAYFLGYRRGMRTENDRQDFAAKLARLVKQNDAARKEGDRG